MTAEQQRAAWLREYYAGYAGRHIHAIFPAPPELTVDAARLGSREIAYAFACRLMAEADRLWTEEAR